MARKPVSVEAKRKQAVKAWDDWLSGKIDGQTRDELAAPYCNLAGFDTALPGDVDAFLESRKASASLTKKADKYVKLSETWERKAQASKDAADKLSGKRKLSAYAKSEREHQKAAKYAETLASINDARRAIDHSAGLQKQAVIRREAGIESRLTAGELSIMRAMDKSVASGKKSLIERDAAVFKWRDGVERDIRLSIDRKAAEYELLRAKGFLKDTDRQPGIEWQGGQLRAGSVFGETLPKLAAVSDFIDKYHRSTLPGNGIVPNANIRAITNSGERIEVKVPVSIMEDLQRQSAANRGIQPDATAFLIWLEMYDVEDIELFADDADVAS